jgi:hypothetical protein
MSDLPPEILVIGTDTDMLSAQLGHLRALGTVVGMLPPRLALVRLPAGEALPPLDGLVYLDADEQPPVALSADERLFVDAWRLRFTPKERPGDGRNWDSPGFQPPDAPGRPRQP